MLNVRFSTPAVIKLREPCDCDARYFYKDFEFKFQTDSIFECDKKRHVFECVDCGDKKYSEWIDVIYATGLQI